MKKNGLHSVLTALLSGAVGCVAIVLFCLIAAACVNGLRLSEESFNYICGVCTALAALIAGIAYYLFRGRPPIVPAILTGLFLWMFLLFTGMIASGTIMPQGIWKYLILLICLVCPLPICFLPKK